MTRRLAIALAGLVALAAAPPPASDPLAGLVARSLGPATMSGRVTAIAVVESDPRVQYVAAASGGLWKTSDDGKTRTCVFPGRPYAAVGAVAVSSSNPEVVWVGTGEANPRNSVSRGNGVFVSRDAGRTWARAGLAETHHIGRIAVHPDDPNTAYVAALGHLWDPNPERGLFGTTDGGRSWRHLLKLDSETGCIDVALDPEDPTTIYAAAYRVRRDGFSGPNPAVQTGPLAGLYKSRDAGKTWKRLTRGLPTSPLGRIGISVWRKDPRLIYAVVQTERTDIRNVPGQKAGYGPIEIGGVFVSRDKGESWVKLNDLCPRPFYFGQVRIHPTDSRRVWVLGIPLFVSSDGGRSFSAEGARGTHYDHHDLWVNPANPLHLLLGTDGGLYTSRDGGRSWAHAKNLPIGQFYAAAVDSRTPYRIVGGLQDNGTWMGPSRTNRPVGILNEDWQRILGMDGFQCQVPPDDPATVYAEGQYGKLHRIDVPSRHAVSIQPRSTRPDTPPFRFNWSAPLVLSAHETKTLYFGGNHLFKSADRGQTWRIVSPDLTRGGTGPSAHTGHTLTALAESPLRAGVVYAGTDDGRVHVTKDDGKTWAEVSARLPGVPAARWVTRIEASAHAPGTAWLSLSRHRHDDWRPYLFRTDDYGMTWRSIVANLPREGPIHTVRGDARNPELLFVGTELGLYVSLDAGASWLPVKNRLPPCPVHDLVIHPRERELVVATHGRGLYVLDVAPLQELSPKAQASRVHLFDVREVTLRRPPGASSLPSRGYAGENPAAGAVLYYRLAERALHVSVEVAGASRRVAALLRGSGAPGLHRLVWDLKDRDGAEVPPGEYVVRLRVGDVLREKKLRVRAAEGN
jgi:photosystem II stability/assembly factor-like uncharacterized protein